MVNDVPTIQNLEVVFTNVIKSALALGGIVLFVMLVLGSFRYITSSGDPKSVDAAKKTITYAIGGLILVVLSYLILVLIKNITGVDVTQFKVTVP